MMRALLSKKVMKNFAKIALSMGDGSHIVKTENSKLVHFEMEGGFIYFPCLICNSELRVLEIRENVRKEYFAAVFAKYGIDNNELSSMVRIVLKKY